ncbi:MAG TPA: hypothetical protein VFL64_13670 [Rhizobacter sp.]|nr:hypothetical protein [Rhizobacter sp.]
MAAFALAGTVLVLSACVVAPAQLNPATPPTYSELMASADEAHKKGGVVEAMGLYEKAAKADPAKKEPWARIAQAQFDARNYGSAITAAQEVLQRDTTDVTAKSIMAVSGLRVSAGALEQLRFANALGGGTREEAQALARIMRDALGESILPTPNAATAGPTGSDKPVARPPVRRTAVPPAAPPVASPAAPPATAEPKRNPFDALKG